MERDEQPVENSRSAINDRKVLEEEIQENGIIEDSKRRMRSDSPTSCQRQSKLERKVKTQNDVFHRRNKGPFGSVDAKKLIYHHKNIKSNTVLEGDYQPACSICPLQAGQLFIRSGFAQFAAFLSLYRFAIWKGFF